MGSEKKKNQTSEFFSGKKNKQKLELAIFFYKILYSGLFFQNRQLEQKLTKDKNKQENKAAAVAAEKAAAVA